MAAAPPGDPRAAAQDAPGMAPVVALPRGGPPWIVVVVGFTVAGVLLFLLLDARRQALIAPAVRPGASDRAASLPAALPPLNLPPAPAPPPPVVALPPPPAPPVRIAPPQPQIVYMPQPAPVAPQQPAPQPRVASEPVLIVDTTSGDAPQAPREGASAAASGEAPAQAGTIAGGRVRSAQLANRTNTVPQGTLIPAVLETGFDSTRPGLARAMVTADVHGFDGKRVLIPRGSRLIGEYKSDTALGQNRALVNWTRLIRPDGATIEIGSPASDPVGRGGIKAKVNDHFFQRFAGAILQSSLDIGVNLATRAAGGTSPVIVALPGAAQNVAQPITQKTGDIPPTLRVNPGTSITVFVAHDLDFASTDNRP